MELVTVDDVNVFVMSGEFDAFSMPMLGDLIDQALGRGEYEFVIDMCEVTFVDMSTLNRIAGAMKEVYRHNGHLDVACAGRNVLRAFDLAGLRLSVRIYQTREEAIARLKERAPVV